MRRGGYVDDKEQFFILKDGSPISPTLVRDVLRKMIARLNLRPELYNTHSLRVGRAVDMLSYGYSIPEIQRAGRWRSNAVFCYLRHYHK